jgi:7-cyano-7-deazaguanine synthase
MQIGSGSPGEKVTCLLSGGADSATVLYWCKANFKDIYVVSFNYGQRHVRELEMGARLTDLVGVKERSVINIDFSQIKGSPLSDPALIIPRRTDNQQRSTVQPYRNTVLVTLAAAFSEVRDIHDIAMGPCAEDFGVYRDCRLEFFDTLHRTLILGGTQEQTELRLHLPYINAQKKDIIRAGLEMGVHYDLTHTCYEGQEEPCVLRDLYVRELSTSLSKEGMFKTFTPREAQKISIRKQYGCDSCLERLVGFEDNNIVDPLIANIFNR